MNFAAGKRGAMKLVFISVLPTSLFCTFSPPQDYPSLALLGEKLAENNIHLIFAVTKSHYMLYKVSAAELPVLGGD